MKVWIPMPGDALRLLATWSATLKCEYRNAELIAELTGQDKDAISRKAYSRDTKVSDASITLNAGDEVVFDRVYVRQGADDFASVTLIIKRAAERQLIGHRFWARLDEVNGIDAKLIGRGHPVGGFALKHYRALAADELDPVSGDRRAAAKLKRKELDLALEACGSASGEHEAHARKIAIDILKQHSDAQEAENKKLPADYHSTFYALSEQCIQATIFAMENVSNGPKNHRSAFAHWAVKSTTKEGDETVRLCVFSWPHHGRAQSESSPTSLKTSCGFKVTSDAGGSVKSVTPRVEA